MITKYEVRKIKKEELLILYLDYNFEFGKDINNNSNIMVSKINDFIKGQKIKFNGNKVLLVVGGLVLGSLVLGNISDKPKEKSFDYVSQIILNSYNDKNEVTGYSMLNIKEAPTEKKEEIKKEEKVEEKPKESKKKEAPNASTTPKKETPAPNKPAAPTPPAATKTMVTIHRNNGTVLVIELEEYLIGVVAAEMPASFNIEALKAQTIAARTYTLRAIKNKQRLTDDSQTQEYRDANQLKTMWGNNFNAYYNKVKSAVDSTKGMYMTYNGDYIQALYHSTSNGMTESSYEVFGNDLPYLKSVSSIWDVNTSSYLRTSDIGFDVLNKTLGLSINEDFSIEILKRSASGRVSSVRLGENYYTGIELRKLLGLRSADFDIEIKNGSIFITTRGYGHGVGMSQYGANGMANIGKNFTEILKHYYQGVTIKK